MQAQKAHSQRRQIAAVLVGALLALSVLHCVPVAAAAMAADPSQPTMMVSHADQRLHPSLASADSAMHCPVIGSVLTTGNGEHRLPWPVSGPGGVVMQQRYMFDTAAGRAPPHHPSRPPGAAGGRALLHQLCVNRR
ncbi:hypothetical protein D2E64_11470 [Mycobacteroides abscessus]|uniref:hypothetical protein n=1 Tax=Mycobacteroides abscessus TaxID=36809 RepID=UPI000D3EB54D|nr:hypothetical protein [Mycobacteroides abscessus]PVA72281.1 hypothetical protein DDJ76_23060 [Mycobacteroides abscessus]RIS03953.1 hypothetical protein D2E63_22680 [Mycobacteroides abscessus]RIS11291.1 hypothetical protein D2E69_22130 [Mycobacteroides abscessus]RIS23605.1 hypothetical protein D2E67_22325 [Mycobacteroides abscessus]RIT15749.1 hypothetical protein D2E64_11470 [Mycobacteroides abscessus]